MTGVGPGSPGLRRQFPAMYEFYFTFCRYYRFAMPYRQTDNVARKLAARRDAILAAASEAAAEGGMAAVQMAPVALRAGIAAGTVYRYFPSKTDLVAALVAALSEREMAALEAAAHAAPGPLSALAAAITTFCARTLARRRLAFALIAEPVEPEVDAARAFYRRALVTEFEELIRKAAARRASACPGCAARRGGAGRRADRGLDRAAGAGGRG